MLMPVHFLQCQANIISNVGGGNYIHPKIVVNGSVYLDFPGICTPDRGFLKSPGVLTGLLVEVLLTLIIGTR